MTLTLHLPPETENRLRQWASQAGKNPETVALEAIEEKLIEESLPLSQPSSAAEFRTWFVSHPASTAWALDDSRSSIYEGRGE